MKITPGFYENYNKLFITQVTYLVLHIPKIKISQCQFFSNDVLLKRDSSCRSALHIVVWLTSAL